MYDPSTSLCYRNAKSLWLCPTDIAALAVVGEASQDKEEWIKKSTRATAWICKSSSDLPCSSTLRAFGTSNLHLSPRVDRPMDFSLIYETANRKEEDEEARRKRIAERIAQMRGLNPLVAPPPSPEENLLPPFLLPHFPFSLQFWTLASLLCTSLLHVFPRSMLYSMPI